MLKSGEVPILTNLSGRSFWPFGVLPILILCKLFSSICVTVDILVTAYCDNYIRTTSYKELIMKRT